MQRLAGENLFRLGCKGPTNYLSYLVLPHVTCQLTQNCQHNYNNRQYATLAFPKILGQFQDIIVKFSSISIY